MGYIDSDTHVYENDRTWEHFDPAERHLAPTKVDGLWNVDGMTLGRSPFNDDNFPPEYHELFPRGSVDVSEPGARITRMDSLGMDVHVMFASWWITIDVPSPEVEAALARSWNRWMAECAAESNGRLRWALQAPVRTPERALEEMEFGRNNGAVAVHVRGVRHGMGVAHPDYLPLFERAQDLDLVIAVHTGGDVRVMREQPQMVFLNNVAPVAGAFYSILDADLPARFPRMRWAFLEAGASWLPFVIQEKFRGSGGSRPGQYRTFRDWHSAAVDVLARDNLYVACQIDDDIPYLVDLVGSTNLVHGTDYGHLDFGSDPYGHQQIANNPTIDSQVRRQIVDDNGRALWGIDANFTPAPSLANGEVPEVTPVPNWNAGLHVSDSQLAARGEDRVSS